MSRTNVLLLASLLGCECRAAPRPPKSIKPAVPVSATLIVPLLDHDLEQVIVDARVPTGYRAELSDAASFDRAPWDPEISFISAFDRRYGTVQAPDFMSDDCSTFAGRPTSIPVTYEPYSIPVVRVRREPRSDGSVFVCKPAPIVNGLNQITPWTMVVRNLRWRGDQFQCQVKFGGDVDFASMHVAPVTYDHGKPSPARIDDAIAICDSMTLRPPPAEGSNTSGLSGSEDPP